ncbi:MAG TPA: NAD(P)-dependent oxidoreductase [Vicinamibacterales bacterium]|nr:NAD(P)-dependent oxidoreductase [Vicinamibacterales bacterium]
MSDARVLGFVGVGRMGGPMSSRLLDAGYELVIFDTNADATAPLAARGARIAGSAAEVASIAPIVFLSLPTPPVLQSVAIAPGGIISGTAVTTVIDVSTTGPGVAGVVAKALAEKDITYVDSPVSGGIAGATKGTLAVMVACPKATWAEVEPILTHFGKTFYTGEKAGLAQTAKLANNLLAAAAIVLSSEAIVMGVKAGLDPKILIDIINAGSGRNSATQDKFPKAVLTRTFDFGFATGLSYKDVKLCVDEAEALGVPMVAGAAVRQMLAVTQAKFGADSDFTSIARVVEEWAGVEIKG